MSGHHETHIGLQRHSVGECYPLAVVGYQQGPDTEVVYTVENLATGEVLCGVLGRSPWQTHHADLATMAMLEYSKGHSGLASLGWYAERPHFGFAGWLIFEMRSTVGTPIQVYNAVMEADNA